MKKNKIVNKIGILVLELMFARIFFGFYDYEQR